MVTPPSLVMTKKHKKILTHHFIVTTETKNISLRLHRYRCLDFKDALITKKTGLGSSPVQLERQEDVEQVFVGAHDEPVFADVEGCLSAAGHCRKLDPGLKFIGSGIFEDRELGPFPVVFGLVLPVELDNERTL